MFQSDLGTKPTGQQREATEQMGPMEPMEIAPSAGPGRAGMGRYPTLLCRREGPEPRNGIQRFRWILNCGALAFGMDAKHAVRNFQFQPAAPERLRRDLLV